jgi:hypothetical protein
MFYFFVYVSTMLISFIGLLIFVCFSLIGMNLYLLHVHKKKMEFNLKNVCTSIINIKNII